MTDPIYLPPDGIPQIFICLVWAFLVQTRTTFLSDNSYFEIQI